MNPLLEVRGVSASYRQRRVLHSLDLDVAAGEVVALLGPNGAGKSTLVAVVSNVLRPDEGEVRLLGAPLSSLSRRELARRLAVVPQVATLPEGFRVLEIVQMGRTPYLRPFGAPSEVDDEAVGRALEATGAASLADRRVEELSGGERQRVVLARALAQGPQLLLLDEPTSHLDLRYQVEVARLARAAADSGVGVLFVAHDLNLAARLCDRVVLLSEGRVVASGPPGRVLEAQRLSSVYQTEVEVRSTPQGPLVVPHW